MSSQIQVSGDVKPLLDTVADFLRFTTEFFECISQSGPHIYHSALALTPKSSIIWKLYSQEACSPVERVVTGVPASWGSCTASIQTTDGEMDRHAIWSPSGQSIAAVLDREVEVRDSITLQRISIFKTPSHLLKGIPRHLAFSPNGLLLACSYTL